MRAKKRILIGADALGISAIRGIQKFLLAHAGYQPYFCLVHHSSAQDVRLLRRMIERIRPHGILASVLPENMAVLKMAGRPIVNIKDTIIETAIPTVMFDHAEIGRLAAEHLVGLGLRHFAYGSVKSGGYAGLRWQGFRETLQRAGFGCSLFDDSFPNLPAGSIPDELVCQWVAALPKPVGIHTSFTFLAMQVVWACQELGLKIPVDAAVLGGMDLPEMTTMWEPTLSAFELPEWRVGYEGMKLLDRLLRKGKPPSKPILIPPGDIIQRQSTDALILSDPEVAMTLQFIRDNAHRPISVKDLLEHVPLSRRALERRFEKTTGHTLHEGIVRAHMDAAKRLLRETPRPMGQVAIDSGFSSYTFFAGAFHEYVGMTPSEYRRQLFDP